MSGVVARLDELAPDAPVRVEVDGQPVVLVRTGEDVHALHDTCSHAEASLAEGVVVDGEIECHLHGAMFSLTTGRPSCLPATTPVPTYAVTIDDGDVVVDATDPTNGAAVPDHW